MRIKTYVFDDVKEGMKKIKEEHGVDTIIVDIKNNGATGAKKGCEISVAVEGERAVQGDDLGDLRRRLENVWDHAARFVNSKIGDMGTELARDRVKTYPLPLRIFFDKMVRNGLDSANALSIVAEVHCSIGPLAEDSLKAAFFMKRTVGTRIRVHNPVYSKAPIAILGPSGAGKSATVKKIARMCSGEAIRVSILAYEPLRRNPRHDLRAFTEESAIPFSVVSGEEDLVSGLKAGGTRKIIDLSGPTDLQMKAAERLQDIELAMVLPAGARDEKMKYCCDQMKGHNLTGLIFTKLDEEETVGHVFDNLLKLGLPLSFLTTGTEDADILTPSSDLLYKILIEGNTWKRKESVLLP
jgi:flagellar biosynthesis GTPase FlhF